MWSNLKNNTSIFLLLCYNNYINNIRNIGGYYIVEYLFEKFNIFDLFTMLIPGVIILTLSCTSLSFAFYEQWANLGNEKYIIFFAVSYLIGITFQQIGDIIDGKCLYKIIYGGNPKEIFLLKDKYMKILNNELAYKDALNIKRYLVDHLNINTKDVRTIEQQKQLNTRIFSYCLNIVEVKEISFKAEKMLAISEMSRSLSLGCIFIILLNLFMVLYFRFYYVFYFVESIVLLFLSGIFLYRKIQYEKYRYRIILRMFLIYIKGET